MEEERTHREIELRSEEVQEVMGRIPPAILRYGIVLPAGLEQLPSAHAGKQDV